MRIFLTMTETSLRHPFEDIIFEVAVKKSGGTHSMNVRRKSGETHLSMETLRTTFSRHGVVKLCLDLMAPGIHSDLSVAAVKVLLMLLSKKGGCVEVQATIFACLSETDSVPFFEFLKESLGACV
jgi:hypothetical protein